MNISPLSILILTLCMLTACGLSTPEDDVVTNELRTVLQTEFGYQAEHRHSFLSADKQQGCQYDEFVYVIRTTTVVETREKLMETLLEMDWEDQSGQPFALITHLTKGDHYILNTTSQGILYDDYMTYTTPIPDEEKLYVKVRRITPDLDSCNARPKYIH